MGRATWPNGHWEINVECKQLELDERSVSVLHLAKASHLSQVLTPVISFYMKVVEDDPAHGRGVGLDDL